MKNFFSLVIISIALIVGCNSRNSTISNNQNKKDLLQENSEVKINKVYTANFEEDLNNTQDLFLSDISDTVYYIPLETTTKYLIGEKGLRIRKSENLIFVGQHNRPIGVFNNQGKFLYTIGKLGKGPKEVNGDYYFSIDKKTRKVIFNNASRRCLTEYDWEGNFIRDYKSTIRSFSFAMINNSYLLWNAFQEKNDKGYYRLAIANNNGEVIKPIYEEAIDKSKSKSSGILSPMIIEGYTGILFNSWEGDIIYRFTYDTIFQAAFKANLGKYKVNYSLMENWDRFQKERRKYIIDINAVESERNWYIKFFKKDLGMAVLPKDTQKLIIVNNPDTKQNGVYNDIDGGPSFWPFWDVSEGKLFFKCIPAIDMIEYCNESDNKQPKNQKAASNLHSLVAKLDENDNPILMVVKLK